jgi:6-phosphogluconolactonase/glucosamine-6-phosphate isomerase/deaminase
MKLNIDKNTSKLLQNAQEELTSLLHQNAHTEILLLLSGGSAFALLEGITNHVLGDHITLAVLDERASIDPDINNFAQLTNTNFYKSARAAGCKEIDTLPHENESKEELAIRFEQSLKSWKESNPNGIVIATIGMGPDGHTSGVMPFPEDAKLFEKLFCSENWVVAYDAGDKNQYPLRVTTTLTFMNNVIDKGIVYITGENKRSAIELIADENIGIHQIPAKILKEMDVKVFTDINSIAVLAD